MKDFVSDRRITIAASISSLLLGWSVFANPVASWPGMLSIAALGTLLVVATTVLLLGRVRAPAASLSQVIWDVDKEAAGKPADWKGKAVL